MGLRSAAAATDRTFAAVVFDWDGTAVPDRVADARAVRERVEALCTLAVDVAVVSGTHVGNIDGQLGARPAGPGRLHLCLNRGSEVFEVGAAGPTLVWRRQATPEEDAALDRAAAAMVAELAERGIEAAIVSSRLNRRKIDLIPEPSWADPPKARIGELVVAVSARLEAAGLDLPAVVTMAEKVAATSGVVDPRITSDAKHVEIGLTDKSDSMRWLLADYWRRGIGAGLVLVGGDEFGPLGGVRGSDDYLLVPEAHDCTAVSVGVEPEGTPAGVVHLGGGPERFLRLLDDQLCRRAELRVPEVDDRRGWALVSTDDHDQLQRTREAQTTLADGRFGTRGSLEEDGPGSVPMVVALGVYRPDPDITAALLPAPDWTTLPLDPPAGAGRRLLDLHTGVLWRENDGLRTVRFMSLARPGAAVLRAEGPVTVLGDPGTVTEERLASSPWGAIATSTRTTSQRSGGRRLVERLAAHVASGEPGCDGLSAAGALADLSVAGFDRLLAEQRATWGDRWERCDIAIPGQPELELSVRFAMFHLMASVASQGESAVGARGMSGPAYGGHVFWDADVFVLPMLAATHPPSARAMLEYRIRRIGEAQGRAAEQGCRGARFPWESAADGADVTPRQGATGRGTVVPILTGDEEEHIVADVAWAAAEYAAWTGDDGFARGPGHMLLVETARYWASRVERDTDGSLHLRGVIGPDEYHETVDDNAYTNVMARWNLRAAAESADRNGGVDPNEVRGWRAAAEALVDGFDQATGVYEQFAGYFGLEPLVATDVAPAPAPVDLLLGHERVVRSQLIKQPDVGMLHLLVPDEVAPGSLGRNLDYYLPRTADGSSLSPAVCAALLARAGRPDEALLFLRLAARLDLDDTTGTTAVGLHVATMGGLWQALVVGLAGVRPLADAVVVDPMLPAAWSELEIRLGWHGRRVGLTLSHSSIGVTTDGCLRVRLTDGDHVIEPPGTVLALEQRK